MKFLETPIENIPHFSQLFIDYVQQNPKLVPFYAFKPDLEGFKSAIKHRKFSQENRELLHNQLINQYINAEVITNEPTKNNIDLLLHPKTFTVTTGHQICLMTGPMYFIFKIITTIQLAKVLKKEFPNHNFVPIYWMATEDHDFEEINHCHLFGNKITWESDQKGAVGRFETNSLNVLLNKHLPKHTWVSHYLTKLNLADATLSLVNDIFQTEGLVIINPDNKELKSKFLPYLKNDIFEQSGFENVTSQNNKLQEVGYKPQIHSREINVFYLQQNIRERIVFENNVYKVLNTDVAFSKAALEQEMQSFPEKFSPNVVLRPLYQETILPNIGYIGGPGELAYWFELKSLFDSQNIDFPVLIPRNFANIITKNIAQKIEKLELQYSDFFKPLSEIKKHFLSLHSNNEFDFNISKNTILAIFETTKSEIIAVDGSLAGFAQAQSKEIENVFDAIHKKTAKAKELKETVNITKIETIYAKLFPENQLQERHENILNFIENQPDLIQSLCAIFNPFSKNFYTVILD